MSVDGTGSGETYDNGEEYRTADAVEPQQAPEYADPAEAGTEVPDPAGEDTSGDLSDLEPEEQDDILPTDDRRPADGAALAPATTDRQPRAETEDDLNDADIAAEQARDIIGREAMPAEQTRAKIDGDSQETADPATEVAAAPEPDVADEVDSDDQARQAAAAEVAGHAAVDGAVEGPGDGESATTSEVDDVDKQLSAHDQESADKGKAGMPDVDLDDVEAFLEHLDLDTDLIASQRGLVDGDDSWEHARDAAGSSDGDLDAAEEAAAEAEEDRPNNVIHHPFGPQTEGDKADEDEAPNNGLRSPLVLVSRQMPSVPDVAPPGEIADNDPINIYEAQPGDSPGGAREYPQALVDYTDVLMGEGEAGEELAIAALERYELTGELPSILTPDIPQPAVSPEDDTVSNGGGTPPLF